MQRVFTAAVLVALSGLAVITAAQNVASVKRVPISGEVTAIDGNRISLRLAKGSLQVEIAENTVIKRFGSAALDQRPTGILTVSHIAIGDRLFFVGDPVLTEFSVAPRTIFLVSRADFERKEAEIAASWKIRGISGKVLTVDRLGGEIVVEIRGLAETTRITVKVGRDTRFKRYAAASARYADAVAGSFDDPARGDTIRALGDKSADGRSFIAEEIVTGSFRTLVGYVQSVDVARSEIHITDWRSLRTVTVFVGTGSSLKRLPDALAFKMTQARWRVSAANIDPNLKRRAARSVDDLFEEFPRIDPANLQVGQMIAVSTTRQPRVGRVIAIKVLAGIEPLFRVLPQNTAASRGRTADAVVIPGFDLVEIP